MSFYLLKFNADWADEFDVDGIVAFTSTELEKYKEKLNSIFSELSKNDIVEWYFGTNEFFEYENIDELWSDLDLTEITEVDYNIFIRLVGKQTGYIPFN